MKALKSFAVIILFGSAVIQANGQSDSSLASQRALLYADKLTAAFHDNNLDEYLNISYPGVITYYGGKHQFREYIQRARALCGNELEKCELVQLENDNAEWQCVVRKMSETEVDGKKAKIISYLVGQSKDHGNTWKYFDVAYNSVDNIAYIMPDIFNTLSIPQRQVVFDAFGDTATHQQ